MNKWTVQQDMLLSDTSKSYDELLYLLLPHNKRAIWSRAAKLGYKRDKNVISKINSSNQHKEEWDTLLLDKDFNEVIDGELLADGCIYRKSVKNRRCYEYSFIAGSICGDYADYLHNYISQKLGSTANISTVKRKGCKPFYSIRFSSVIFKSFYDRWYKNCSIKTTVPSDLVLTPTKCLHWYMGDGSLDSRLNARMFEITLHTENFCYDIVEILKNKLSDTLHIRAGLKRVKNGKYVVIRIHGDYARSFLSYIGHCPVEGMSYKWKDWKSLK